MKKYLISICIVLVACITMPTASAQTGPILPSLQSVMKKNEKIVKENLQRENIKKKAPRTLSGTTIKSLTYQTLIAGNAVRLSRYNEVELWVQEIDLSKGARLESLLTQSGYDSSTGEPLFEKKRISDVLSWLNSKPFSLINWQFFDPRREYTPLSFGVKEWSIVRTAWADIRNQEKNILIIGSTGARLDPYSWDNLSNADGYFAMVNFTIDERHHSASAIGRTYICLQNMNTDNESSTLLIFTALTMSETDIEKEFPRWWCTRNGVAKLDASGSTRLWTGGEYIFGKSHKWDPDYRRIPHYLAVWDR